MRLVLDGEFVEPAHANDFGVCGLRVLHRSIPYQCFYKGVRNDRFN